MDYYGVVIKIIFKQLAKVEHLLIFGVKLQIITDLAMPKPLWKSAIV